MNLNFKGIGKDIKKKDWKILVYNDKNAYLGEIIFWKEWNCWIWEQDVCVLMSSDHLQQIINKLRELDSIAL